MRGDTCCRMDELENSILPEIHYGQDLLKSYSSPDKVIFIQVVPSLQNQILFGCIKRSYFF